MIVDRIYFEFLLITTPMLFDTLRTIGKHQFELESMRQLLCEQIQFVPELVYNQIASYVRQYIDIFSLTEWSNGSHNVKNLESVIKFYSGNQLKLNYQHFQRMVLAREDNLIHKLTKQRRNNGQVSIPVYLKNYVVKLWQTEESLHSYLEYYRNQSKNGFVKELQKYRNDVWINNDKLRQQFVKYYEQNCEEECPGILFDLALRYIKQGTDEQQLHSDAFSYLFTHQNCNTISIYLHEKEEEEYEKEMKIEQKSTATMKYPYVHKQFNKIKKKALKKHNQSQTLCFRQIKSLDQHMKQKSNIPSSAAIKQKIQHFSKDMQNHFLNFDKYLKKIIKVIADIQRYKEELTQNYPCNFERLFKQISNHHGNNIVPSQLQHYLMSIGVHVQLRQLFVIFKRYGDPVAGKLNMKRFRNIFVDGLQRKEEGGEELDKNFRTAAIGCLLGQIKLQAKIQKFKRQMLEQIPLREIFSVLDVQKKGRISYTDLQVAFKRITNKLIRQQQLQILWGRMGKKLTEYVDYDTFMFEMLPKTKQKVDMSKTSKY